MAKGVVDAAHDMIVSYVDGRVGYTYEETASIPLLCHLACIDSRKP
jgi:hypothetical protein